MSTAPCASLLRVASLAIYRTTYKKIWAMMQKLKKYGICIKIIRSLLHIWMVVDIRCIMHCLLVIFAGKQEKGSQFDIGIFLCNVHRLITTMTDVDLFIIWKAVKYNAKYEYCYNYFVKQRGGSYTEVLIGICQCLSSSAGYNKPYYNHSRIVLSNHNTFCSSENGNTYHYLDTYK